MSLTIEECWRWEGYNRPSDGRPVAQDYVYRMIYRAAGGHLEEGQGCHHRCENPWCINPFHLEPMTQSEHALEHGHGGDWGQSAKTRCPKGHEYDAENTYTYERKNGTVERHCRKCQKINRDNYRDRRIAAGLKPL